jgi:hypothetical protein
VGLARRLASLTELPPGRGSMNRNLFLGGAAVLVAAATPADKPAEIAFANHGGIWDWKAEGHDAILIKSRSSEYYRATFIAPCFSLPFAERVGFVTDARDVLDRFDSITVGHEQCFFQSFTQIPKPGKW